MCNKNNADSSVLSTDHKCASITQQNYRCIDHSCSSNLHCYPACLSQTTSLTLVTSFISTYHFKFVSKDSRGFFLVCCQHLDKYPHRGSQQYNLSMLSKYGSNSVVPKSHGRCIAHSPKERKNNGG